ncbi:unnamed protein product [Prunus armeniaca]|uniref:Uncharacterized protein n=1 Tax=Prunus armeniaca TaxID=36596 RepID=A0A6J5XRV7_PRUAR|nr:unnamed protein product [Prunus armeniaca]
MKGYDNRNREGKKTKVGGIVKRDILTCDMCGKNHGGTWHKKTGACFKCGKTGISYKTAHMLKKINGEHIRIEGYKDEFTP